MEKDLVKMWKDPMNRPSLAESDPGYHPAGLIEISDDDLREASGGITIPQTTALGCTESSFHGWKSCCP